MVTLHIRKNIRKADSLGCLLFAVQTAKARHTACAVLLRRGVRREKQRRVYSSIPEWVRTGAVDFGFVNPHAVKGLETMVVKSGEFRAVVPAGHPLAARKSVTLEDLEGEPFLLLEGGVYSEPEEAFAAAGIVPDVRLRVHDDYSILSMIEQGMGVSILTELVLCKTAYDVAALPIDPPVIRTLAVVTKDRRTLPLAARVFIDQLMAQREQLL